MSQDRLADFVQHLGMSAESWERVPTTTLRALRDTVMDRHTPGSVVFRSSGSTGAGSELAYSQSVIDGAARRARELLRLSPLVSGMRVAVCFGYGCFPPADFYQRALVNEGCDVLPLGSGRNLPTEFKCQWLSRIPPHGLIGMPSYLFRIGRMLERQKLLASVQSQLLFLVAGGEPLGLARRNALRKLFGVPVFDHYGLLEAPMVAGSCKLGRLHVSVEYACEVLSDETIRASGRGELLLSSSAAWHGLTLLRLRTGDEASLDINPCRCGFVGPVVEIFGRMNNERKVKGVRLSLPELHRCLMDVPVVDYYLEVVRDKDGQEQATLHVDADVSAATIRAMLRSLTPAQIDVKVVEGLVAPIGATGKSLRFVETVVDGVGE